MKCCACGRKIINAYQLDGKIYGYNCYRQALSIKYADLQEKHNADYGRKCAAAIEIFTQKEPRGNWNKKFKQSILNQWQACQKLTNNQLQCIIKKFTNTEMTDYYLTYYELSENLDNKSKKYILNQIVENNTLNNFKNDQRLHNLIKEVNHIGYKIGRKYFIISYEDIFFEDDIINITKIISSSSLDDIKNNEFIEINEIIEIK